MVIISVVFLQAKWKETNETCNQLSGKAEEYGKITFDFMSLLVRVWSDYGSFTAFAWVSIANFHWIGHFTLLPLRRRKWKLFDTLWKHTYFMRTSKKKLASHKRTFLNRGNAYTRWPFFLAKLSVIVSILSQIALFHSRFLHPARSTSVWY